jgi:large subunit ribosomal protein L14
MIQLRTILDVADNTGAKRASMIGVLYKRGKMIAKVGDIITCNVKESTPDAIVKKGEVARAVIVRTKNWIKRKDGSAVKFDSNALVFIDPQGNPRGTRVFGPIAREIREREFIKIASLAPEMV